MHANEGKSFSKYYINREGKKLVKFTFGSDPKLLKGSKCGFHY